MHHSVDDEVAMTQVEFYLDDFVCNLQMEDDSIMLKCIKAWKLRPLASCDKAIELVRVISTSFEPDCWKVDSNGQPLLNTGWFSAINSSTSSCHCLVINTWKKTSNKLWKLQTIKLRTLEREHCILWHKRIDAEVTKSLTKFHFVRPRNLLVLVNPFAGLKKGKLIYDTIMSPLFDLASIERDVVVTQYQNHAKEYLSSADLSKYDGVVAVGGDQTFSEVLNGTLIAQQKSCGISLEGKGVLLNRPVKYAKPPLRIGHVPAGSGNACLYTIQGVSDPETSTLQIVCGECHPMDITSTHDEKGNLKMFSAFCTTFGLISDVLHISHRFRFLGPIRYTLVSLKVFWDFKSYPAEIAFLPYNSGDKEENSKNPSKCRYPCSVCLDESVFKVRSKKLISSSISKQRLSTLTKTVDNQINDSPPANDTNHFSLEDSEMLNGKNGTCLEPEAKSASSNTTPQLNFMGSGEENSSDCYCTTASQGSGDLKNWKVIRGRFVVASSCNNVNSCEQLPSGFEPSSHLADGKLILKLIYSKRWEYLKHLKSIRVKKKVTETPTLRRFETRGFHFRKVPDGTLKTTHRNLVASKSASEAQETKHTSYNLNRGIFTCDGEEVEGDILTAWIHKGLIDIFARGIEE